MAQLDLFWDRMAARYAAQPVADPASYQTKLDATRKLLRPDMEIFEFGCGTGSTALAHAPFVKHIRAVDFSAEMVGIARHKAEEAGVTNVTFDQADITTMPMEAGHYDLVMAHSILHLLKTPQAAIDASFALLKPGGYFVSSTACLATGFLRALGFIAPIGRAAGLLPMLTMFSPDELETMQRKAGFRIEHRWQPAPNRAVFMIARKPA